MIPRDFQQAAVAAIDGAVFQHDLHVRDLIACAQTGTGNFTQRVPFT